MERQVRDLVVVDAHMHLWDIENNYYPWLAAPRSDLWFGDYRPIVRNYLTDDYLEDVDACRSLKTVHLQAMWDPEDPVGESLWLQEQADRTGHPNAIVAFVDFSKRRVRETIEGHLQCRNVRGIRMDLNWHEEAKYRFCDRADYLRDPQWLKGFALLENYPLSFELQIYVQDQAEDALRLVDMFPSVRFALTHAGLPYARDANSIRVWKAAIERFAQRKHVAVKISGLEMFDYTLAEDSSQDLALHCFEAFGPDRCMYGTNLPVSSLYGPYEERLAWYATTLARSANFDADKFFARNAEKFYRI